MLQNFYLCLRKPILEHAYASFNIRIKRMHQYHSCFINIIFQIFRQKKVKVSICTFIVTFEFCTISARTTLFLLVNVCFWWLEMQNNLRFDDQQTAAVGFQYIIKILVCKAILHLQIDIISRKWNILLPLYFIITIFLHKISQHVSVEEIMLRWSFPLTRYVPCFLAFVLCMLCLTRKVRNARKELNDSITTCHTYRDVYKKC